MAGLEVTAATSTVMVFLGGFGYPGYGYYGYPGYGYGDCYLVRRRAVDRYGRVFMWRVEVCD